MRHFAGLAAFAAVALVVAPTDVSVSLQALLAQEPPAPVEAPPRISLSAQDHAEARYHADLAAVRDFRPAYPFWQHIFQIPDGSIIFGSAEDGRLLATFPTRGNWARDGVWTDPALRRALDGVRLTRRLRECWTTKSVLFPMV